MEHVESLLKATLAEIERLLSTRTVVGEPIHLEGQTIIPLRLYISTRGRAKIELGLARGKQHQDRRRDIAERDARRDVERELADAQRGR